MAKVEINGVAEMQLAFSELVELDASGTLDAMLEAEAEVVIKQQQSTAKTMGVVDTGKMISSITHGKALDTDDGKKMFVYPKGSRTRNGGSTRNAEIAFINEYGKTGQPARNFIQTANAKAEASAVAAAEKVYDKFIKSKF